jgi:NADH dehydrogenase [ubiquinone] 1 alpha subcomplex assembly factor 7
VSPFEIALRDRILNEGPITVERYMALCLQHYYATRDPLGAAGDFTTAPEISQMFGELIGLWAVETWRLMGGPPDIRLVELGPGRGTLMADALRAARLAPGFLDVAAVEFVETSPVLRERQRTILAGSSVPVAWRDRFEEIPDGPLLVIANEFFDALPIRQFVAGERGWCERLVGLDGEALTFGLHPEPEVSLGTPAIHGQVLEYPAAALTVMTALAGRLAERGGAALCIDYGYWGPVTADTLQAVRSHAFVDPLAHPGDADLTAHVNFRSLARSATEAGLAVHGPLTQGDFLRALGIEARAASLKHRANPAQSAAIDQALDRLVGSGEKGMGSLFKVLGLSHAGLKVLPGLPPMPPQADHPV